MNRIAVLLKEDSQRELKLFSVLDQLPDKDRWHVFHYLNQDNLKQTLETLKNNGYDRAIIGGGDGSLHCALEETLKLAPHQRVPLAVVPLGTANDFAHSAAHPQSGLAKTLIDVANAPIEKIDVGWVNEIPFLNVVSGGDLTKATTHIPKIVKSIFGKFGYFLNALAQLPQVDSHTMIFEDGDWKTEIPCLGFAVANGRRVGGGLQVAPDAKLDDGVLELFAIPAQSPIELSKIAKEFLKESPSFESHNILKRQVKNLKVTVDSEIQINADGEPLTGREFQFGIAPKLLDMAVANSNSLLN